MRLSARRVAGRTCSGAPPGRRLGADACSRTQRTEGHEHELTNPWIASRKHRFRTDKLSAVAALGNTTGGACCWTPDAALAKRDCLPDIRWSEYLALDAFPHCTQMRIRPTSPRSRCDAPVRVPLSGVFIALQKAAVGDR